MLSSLYHAHIQRVVPLHCPSSSLLHRYSGLHGRGVQVHRIRAASTKSDTTSKNLGGSPIRKAAKSEGIVAKPGSAWSDKELDFFKITVHTVTDFAAFFREEPKDPKAMSPEMQEILNLIMSYDILGTTDWSSIRYKETSRFIKFVGAIIQQRSNVEANVDHFLRMLLELFGYDEGALAIYCEEPLQLDMCDVKTSANPDICIEDTSNRVKLLVQEDKNYDSFLKVSPEAQVFAEAIAAFQRNSRIMSKTPSKSYESHLIPCITIQGTCPVFYLVPVSQELAKAVKDGVKPSKTTKVRRYDIWDMESGGNLSFLMALKIGRLQAFQCFDAFKKFVVSPDIL